MPSPITRAVAVATFRGEALLRVTAQMRLLVSPRDEHVALSRFVHRLHRHVLTHALVRRPG